MIEIGTSLILMTVAPAAWLVLFLWPSAQRLRGLLRKNEELRREHEEIRRGNEEGSREILEKWRAPGEPS
jgi:hypothetical protein